MAMNDAVREMKKTPGRYYLTNPMGQKMGVYAVVEVDSDGRVWQLDPGNKRDGELDDLGWYDDTIVSTEDPEGPQK